MALDTPRKSFLETSGGRVEYTTFGHGNQKMFAFHGFADQSSVFAPLAQSLGDRYTVYAFSLPHHGATVWPRGAYDRQSVMDWVEQIIVTEGSDRFSLMGYSMGGKIAMCLTEEYAHRIDQLILLAPDGLKTYYLYDLVKFPQWLRRLVRKATDRPQWFFSFAQLLLRAGILTKFIHNFLRTHLHTQSRRDRLFHTWESLDAFIPHITMTKKRIAECGIETLCIFGERDEIIPPSAGEALAKDMPSMLTFKTVPKGHLLIDRGLNTTVSDWLSSLC